MSEFKTEQYAIILKAIRENKFLSGNYKIYKFKSMEEFDSIIGELLEAEFIAHKNPSIKTKDGSVEFYDKEYKITEDGIEFLKRFNTSHHL